MKRLLPLLLALLLLAGCATAPDTQTTPSTEQTTAPAPAGLYDPDSAVEAATGGAVRAYPLKSDNYIGLKAMGSRLLLVADDGSLTALKGEDCQEAAVLLTGTQLLGSTVGFDSSAQGAAYYLASSREVVLVNPQLQETKRVALPEEMQGEPVICLADDEIRYCVPGEIRALNLQTGISRLIRSHTYGDIVMVAGHFDGAVLECASADTEQYKRYFFSAQTGQRLSYGEKLLELQTAGKSYLADTLDGKVHRKAFGTLDNTTQCLHVEGHTVSALPMGGALGYEVQENGLQLDFYELKDGKRTASVQLPGVGDPVTFLTTDSHVWILSYEGGNQMLYRWDVSKSPVADETVYTGPLYTAQAPDETGLDACQERVVEMNQKYGLRLHIWLDAVKTPGENTLEAEYQVSVINEMLDALEPVLSIFPERFLQKTVEAGWIHVCLVRDVGGESYVQYWENGDCYIAISDDPVNSFLQGVGFAIDSHVLGNSRDFDDWGLQNPDGFAYDMGSGQTEDMTKYLEGEERAFLDLESMRYPHEDRSRLFAAAVAEGNEEIFTAPAMQSKLLLLCQGIREAYGLEKSKDTYLWEQYLTESIAYQK